MLDWPARMKTLIGLAKEAGERRHSSAAVRIAVGFIVFFAGGVSVGTAILLADGVMNSLRLTLPSPSLSKRF